jgi:hypothetical protein
VKPSKEADSSNSTIASRPSSKPLPDDAFAFSEEDSDLLERARPGPISLEEYARFLKQFVWTKEQHASRPPASGPRFTLD